MSKHNHYYFIPKILIQASEWQQVSSGLQDSSEGRLNTAELRFCSDLKDLGDYNIYQHIFMVYCIFLVLQQDPVIICYFFSWNFSNKR